MNFSKYQKAIFKAVEEIHTIGHIIINAVAGSGKTTTLIEIMKRITGNVIFLAFNKSIAEELGKKCPAHVNCSTLHSAGLNLIRKKFGKLNVMPQKIDRIMTSYPPLQIHDSMKWEEKSEIYELRKNVKKIISICKNTLADYTNETEVQMICDHFSIDFDCENHIEYVKHVMEESLRDTFNIDFDDMIYYPVLYKISAQTPYDYVLVDESQDLNRCQIELILKLVKKPNGRIIAVGDPKQSIYGFRGADNNAMNRIKETLNAVEYPLSVCYRCPSSHLELIRYIVPQIEAKHDASEGTIKSINEYDFVDTVKEESNPLILSRTNAYAVNYCLKMIGKGHRAIIKGREIGSNLTSIVKKMKTHDMEEFYEKLSDWKEKQINKLNKRKVKPPQSAFDTIEDKFMSINLIADDCESSWDVIKKIESMFSDETRNCFVFSTIHKAKGLEADTVYILGPSKIPLKWKGQQEHEFQQELNIKYVAYTRGRDKLVFVKDGK